MDEPEVLVGDGRLRVEFERAVQVGDGPVEVAHEPVGHTTGEAGVGILGCDLNRPVEVRQGGIELM